MSKATRKLRRRNRCVADGNPRAAASIDQIRIIHPAKYRKGPR
jgi:ribosomal protein S14